MPSAPWWSLPLSELTLQGLAAVFANTAYMGIPLFLTAFGDDGALPAIIATLAGNFILIGGAIAVLEKLRAKGPSTLDICREVGGTLIRNPLLVAPILGILFSVSALPLPLPVGNFLDLMAAVAGPAALFALGLSLVGQSLLGNMREVAWVSGLKLFLQPALTLIFALYVFDLGERLTAAAVILGALPAGALVYVIAQQYGIYVQRASASILLTTAISIASVSGLLILFGVG
ncbi:MAG: AEC family transporter [Pseudomonadota bacterium]|nr:AEC family transporter [Pseudomonadota bacterium]